MQDKNQPFQLDEEFVEMLTEAQQKIHGFILKRLVDHHQTNEVLQLTNIVLCRKANDFQIGTNFMAWALTVANFQILSFSYLFFMGAEGGYGISSRLVYLFFIKEYLGIQNQSSR